MFTILFLTSTIFILANAEISILEGGIGYIEEDDIAIIFYVTVKNICKDDLEISVNMNQCCESISSDEVDCNSMTLIGGDMGILPSSKVRNLTLIYPNIYLFNRKGVCSIAVTYRNQFKKKEILTDIHFDTTKSCPNTGNKQECRTIDLDPKQNCNPVDCLIKYSGTTSYFNPECNRCQKVPLCNSKTGSSYPDVAYSPYTNECIDLTVPISKKDLEELEKGQISTGQNTMVNAICHYGKVSTNGECLCNDGWTTATNDEGMYEPGVAQHHLCNIQVGDWNCVNKNRIRITAILIAILAITIISKVVLLMCVMTWCYKYFKKPDKTCARELDPDDKSIILCEELESFEKCLCFDEGEPVPTNRKQKNLKTETVNVSYFPCSPSAFSSIKVSSGSSKVTFKTDQSINLSNTTSSAAISFPEGDSSEEESVNSEECSYDENRSNDVAYGVYCGIDEGDEEEEEEEEVEEEEVEDDEEDDGSKNVKVDNSAISE